MHPAGRLSDVKPGVLGPPAPLSAAVPGPGPQLVFLSWVSSITGTSAFQPDLLLGTTWGLRRTSPQRRALDVMKTLTC